MTATLRNVVGDYGQDINTGEIVFVRSELTAEFSGDYLIMKKVLGGDGCTEIVVDGVTVCAAVDETITLQCKYSLADQTVADTFEVTGQDTEAAAEGTGTLGYNLVVEDDKLIGQTITFTITPVNEGLVYATVKSCDVTKDGQALTIIGHGTDHCVNPIINAAAITERFTSTDVIQGSWTVFKWSTFVADNIEKQGLTCTIALSEAASTDEVEDCTLSN